MPSRKRIERHLTDEELADAIEAAQRDGEARLLRRLCLVRNRYAGDALAEAADRVGVSQPTASRWTDAWNEAGVEGLRPDFGGGRPPKLDAAKRERLATALAEHGPLSTDRIRRLIEAAFDVSYSRRHVSRLVGGLDVDGAVARGRSTVPAEDDEGLEARYRDALDALDAPDAGN